jgi:hypothetical protein
MSIVARKAFVKVNHPIELKYAIKTIYFLAQSTPRKRWRRPNDGYRSSSDLFF